MQFFEMFQKFSIWTIFRVFAHRIEYTENKCNVTFASFFFTFFAVVFRLRKAMFFFVRKLFPIAFLDAFPLYEGGDFNPDDGMMRLDC